MSHRLIQKSLISPLMRPFAITCFLLLGLLQSVSSMQQDLSAWAVPEDYRIFPSGEGCVEPGQNLSELRKENSIWNSEKQSIALVAARRHTIAFQLIIERQQQDLSQVKITASELKNLDDSIPAHQFRMFLEGYVPQGGKYYPDILLPFELSGIHPFSVPHQVEALASIPNQKNQAIWIDLEIPEKTKPGLYNGQIQIAIGKNIQTLQLQLEVLNVTIPIERNAQIVMDLYSSPTKGMEFKQPADLLKAEEKFYQLAHDHRATLNLIPYPQKGTPRAEFLPEFSKDGKPPLDWTNWDWRFAKYISGQAFTDRQPIEQFCLYFNAFWPAMKWPSTSFILPDNSSKEKEEYEQAWKEFAKDFVEHFKKNQWTQQNFVIKTNHSKHIAKAALPIPWNTDTPLTEDDYKAVAYYADLVHRTFKESKPVKIFYRADLVHSFCQEAGCTHPLFDQIKAGDILQQMDHWYFEWEHGLVHPKKNLELRNKGKKSFVYKHGWTCTNPSPTFKALGWQLWAANLDGYCTFNSPHGDLKQRRKPQDPNDESWNNYVMYVGQSLGFDGPLPAIRLKLWRSSLYDYELLKLANEKKPSSIENIVSKVVKSNAVTPQKPDMPSKDLVPYKDPKTYWNAKTELISILR
jgi:hypothetical protein